MNRLYNLDYLRGLAAFGIMLYHYLTWTLGEFKSEAFMGRLGVYGVSIFYVLSGLTLFYVYFNKMQPTRKELLSFFKKRVFRIFPLLWLVTLITILLSRKTPDITDLFLNLTGLFGFITWDKYFSAGVWSIGNELVFYVFFPVFILFIKKYKPLMVLLTLLLLGLYLYFAFIKLTPELTIYEQWKNYVNPLNQVFLFLGGFLIGICFNKIEIKNAIVIPSLILGILLFSFYPVTGNIINIVTGWNRLVFTVICFVICFCFYKLSIQFPKFIHKPLSVLGEASYSVYLIHPIIWILSGAVSKLSNQYFFPIHETVRLTSSIFMTLLISYYVYHYFEKYFIKLGKS